MVSKKELFSCYQPYPQAFVDEQLAKAIKTMHKKIVVLDDDPTGVQAVHDVFVYTDWEKESISAAFREEHPLFFLLTNSRGVTAAESQAMHKDIAQRVCEAAKEQGKEFILVSRSDSTLRGHYPLETETLRQTVEHCTNKPMDGEILFPFFPEGGRYTANNIHYVAEGDCLIPAGETEFAKDRTFGYSSSNLCQWLEEKTQGTFRADSVTTISLEELRRCDFEGICKKLTAVNNFGKVIVNALEYNDVKIFVTALAMAMEKGRNFMFRSAAALVKVIGNVPDKPLLSRNELVNTQNKNGGIVIVGSHVKKTTQQLEHLKQAHFIKFIELNQHLILDEAAFSCELHRVISAAEENVRNGYTAAVSTRRERFDLNNGNKEDELRLAAKISDALTCVISSLKVRPNFIIAKGGITSSDIGTKGLAVKKALVLGQILPGIPVWLTGDESKFAGMSYVIFPGNVGNETALLDAVAIMQPQQKEKGMG